MQSFLSRALACLLLLIILINPLLSQNLNEILQNYETITIELSAKILNLKQQLTNLEAEMKSLQESLIEAKNSSEAQTQRLLKLQKEHQDLTKQLIDYEEQMKNLENIYKAKIKAIEDENFRLKIIAGGGIGIGILGLIFGIVKGLQK